MTLYNEVLPEFQKHEAQLVGISVDGAWCHAAFAQDRHLRFPLAADFEPKGAVAKQYGAYRESDGFAEKALFILDANGKIFWSYCSPIAVNPGLTEFSTHLRSSQKNRGSPMTVLRVPVTPRDHIRGKRDAPITLLEYGDYECPHCGRAYYIVEDLREFYGDQLRLVFRNFPLAQIHPFAESAAEAAEFAGAHNLFWEMHDGIYENQGRLGLPLLFELADLLNLPASA